MVKNYSYNWNLNELFNSLEDYQNQCIYVRKCSKRLLSYGENLCDSKENIYQCYTLLEDIKIMMQKLSVYPILKYHQNILDISALEFCNNFKKFEKEIHENIYYIEQELQKVNIDDIKNMPYDEYSKKYKNVICRLKNINKNEIDINRALDKICSQKYNYKDIYNTLTLLDFDFENISNGTKLTYGNYSDIMNKSNDKIKKETFHKLLNEYKNYINTITNIYCKYVKSDMLYSYTKGYINHMDYINSINGIDNKIYKNIITKLHDSKIFDDYVTVKKAYLGIDNFHIYDIEYKNDICDTINIDVNSCKKIIIDSLAILGEEYKSILNMAFCKNWIKLKRKDDEYNGEYCLNVYSTHPYIFQNYQNDIKSLYKLNKYISYAVYMYFSSKHQCYFNSEGKQFMFEVVSTVNEIFLTEYLLVNEDTSVDIKKELLIKLIDKIIYAFSKQNIKFEFEDYVYSSIDANINLSSDELCRKYIDIIKKYFSNNIVIDKNLKYEWAKNIRFSDRVYDENSAIVVCIALSIIEKIRSSDNDLYINLLKSGSSKKIIELLDEIGINLYDTYYIDNAIEYFKEKLDILKDILNKS